MKKLLTIAVASIVVAAAADGSYSPSIGVTSVPLLQKNNVIPVQFTSLKESGAVKVADLVCTNNIPLSSHLYVYDGGYTAWVLQATGWVPTATVSSAYGIDAGAGASTKDLPAGSAIWLSFPETPGSAINVSFYGKVATSTNTTIVAGTISDPVSTLVCNPTGATVAGGTLVTKLVSGVEPVKGDKITLVGGSSYSGYYSYSKSGYWMFVTTDGDGVTTATLQDPELPDLAANQGFWYQRRGAAGSIGW